jgi:primosomal protein N' (replication factor Y)
MQPDHYSIVYSRNHHYEALYEQELKIRRMPLFPPFVRLIAFLITGGDEAEVRKTATNVAAYCREMIKGIYVSGKNREQSPPEVLGPAPAPLDRLCDRYRWQVLLKGKQLDELHAVCNGALDKAGLATGDVRLSVDVDPENMM